MTRTWRPLGSPGLWKDARAAVALEGRIYLAGGDGYLHVVDGQTGEADVLVGGGWQTRLLATAHGRLYAFDEAGPLYSVDPRGGFDRLDGDWGEARAAVGADRLYVAAGGVLLVAVDIAGGRWEPLGDATWHTELLFAAAGSLFDLEEDGSLYRIAPDDGSWEQLDGDWGDVCAGVGAAGRLHLMATTGALYAVSPTGEHEAVDTGTQWDTRILMASGDTLYALEHSGSLYAIAP